MLAARTPRPPPVSETEKQATIAACEALIRDVLKPRHLPCVVRRAFNYVVEIHGVLSRREKPAPSIAAAVPFRAGTARMPTRSG